jgi:hypothetical protein
MRRALLALCLLLALPALAGAPMIRIDRHQVCLRQVALFYGISDVPEAEAMFRAIIRKENGRPGREAGHENWNMDDPVTCNPCIAEACENYARLARAMIRYSLAFAYRKEPRRVQWLAGFAPFYHAGGPGKTPEERAKNNESYVRALATLYAAELELVHAREKLGGYNPEVSPDLPSPVR